MEDELMEVTELTHQNEENNHVSAASRTMEDIVPMEVEELNHRNEENNQVRDNGHLKYRGLAIIAIFHQFHKGLKLEDIEHTEKDRKMLVQGFTELQYAVLVWNDVMTTEAFFERLKRVSCDPINDECETFALVIITHGNRNGILYAYDGHFTRQDVYNCFKAEKCKKKKDKLKDKLEDKLKDKMKLLIFHACRGDMLSDGVEAHKVPKHKKSRGDKLKEHIEKDYLIFCSTFEGWSSAAAQEHRGSLFIQALYSAMVEEARRDESERKHILALLTGVIRKTANVNINMEETGEIKKQQPALMMALHYLYYFKNKEIIPKECLQRLSFDKLAESN